jgi:antitoxin (DNA-binding transcriptional repressor) of toxin-antitoxin stability system
MVDKSGRFVQSSLMTYLSFKEAKRRLSELGRRAENGETIIVMQHGVPVFAFAPTNASASGNIRAGKSLPNAAVIDQ